MKKTYLILTLVFVTLFSACETYDEYNEDSSPYIAFTFGDLELPLAPGGSITLPPITYFVTDSSSEDRTFNIIVEDSGGITPDNYSIPSSVTIPAGERRGSLTFTTTNNSLPMEYGYIVFAFEETASVSSGQKWTVGLKSN